MSERMKIRRGSGNVFRNLGFRAADAHTLALRSELMICIEQAVRQSGVTRVAMARRLRIARARLTALLCGRLNQFNLDALVTIAARMGLRVELGIVRHVYSRAPQRSAVDGVGQAGRARPS